MPGAVGDAGGLQLLLGLADPGDLRRRVDHPGHGVEVDVAMLAGDALGDRDAFLLGLVREHRAAHDVADRPDVRQVGAAVVVDRDEAALVERRGRPLSASSPAVCGTRPIETISLSKVARLRLARGVGVVDGDVSCRR